MALNITTNATDAMSSAYLSWRHVINQNRMGKLNNNNNNNLYDINIYSHVTILWTDGLPSAK